MFAVSEGSPGWGSGDFPPFLFRSSRGERGEVGSLSPLVRAFFGFGDRRGAVKKLSGTRLPPDRKGVRSILRNRRGGPRVAGFVPVLFFTDSRLSGRGNVEGKTGAGL